MLGLVMTFLMKQTDLMLSFGKMLSGLGPYMFTSHGLFNGQFMHLQKGERVTIALSERIVYHGLCIGKRAALMIHHANPALAFVYLVGRLHFEYIFTT